MKQTSVTIARPASSFKAGSFVRSVLAIAGSTLMGQFLSLLCIPILTRLYDPVQFGHFNQIQLGFALFIPLLTLKLSETFLLLPNIQDVELMSRWCLKCVVVIASISGVAFLILNNLLEICPSSVSLMWTPTLVCLGMIEVSVAKLTRDGLFAKIALGRILAAIFINLFQILAATITPSATSLMTGYLLGNLVVVAYYSLGAKSRLNFSHFTTEERKSAFQWCRKYSNYYRFGVPAELLNAVTSYAPGLLIASQADTKEIGALYFAAYVMAGRLLGIPLQLLGRSVGEVFRQRAAVSLRERGECLSEFLSTTKALAKIAIPCFLLMAIFSKSATSMILGRDWKLVGLIIQMLIPLYLFRMIASPVSSVVTLGQKQRLSLWIDIAVFVAIPLSFYGSRQIFQSSLDHSILAMSTVHGLLYFATWMISYRIARGKINCTKSNI